MASDAITLNSAGEADIPQSHRFSVPNALLAVVLLVGAIAVAAVQTSHGLHFLDQMNAFSGITKAAWVNDLSNALSTVTPQVQMVGLFATVMGAIWVGVMYTTGRSHAHEHAFKLVIGFLIVLCGADILK